MVCSEEKTDGSYISVCTDEPIGHLRRSELARIIGGMEIQMNIEKISQGTTIVLDECS